MPQTCTICRHPRRREIDKAIVCGQPQRHIAGRFRASASAIKRHKLSGHAGIKRAIEGVKEARKATVQRQADELAEVITSDSLVTQLRKLISEAQGIAKEARRTRNLSVAMSGIDKQSRVLELIAKLTGQLDESARVNALVQEREQREAGQATDLARLTVEERIQLEALLAKARGFRRCGRGRDDRASTPVVGNHHRDESVKRSQSTRGGFPILR